MSAEIEFLLKAREGHYLGELCEGLVDLSSKLPRFPDSFLAWTSRFLMRRLVPFGFGLPGMLDGLRKMDDIYEIYDVTGQYYSILRVRTDSTEQLSKIIDEIAMIDGVVGTETVIVLRTVKEELGVIV